MNITNSTTCPAPAVDSDAEKGIKTFAYALTILISLLGNVILVAMVYTTKKMHTITNYQIVNMAIADLLITIAAMPVTVYQIYKGYRWPFGLALCKLATFLQNLSVSCSVFTMVCIAVDRYSAIIFPYKNYITPKRNRIMIILVWLLSVLLQSPTLYAMKVKRIDGVIYCYEEWSPLFDNAAASKIYTVVLFVFMYILPLIVIAALYTHISWFLWSRKTPGSQLGRQKNDRSKTRNVVKMLVIIVIVFAVCWLPVFIAQFVSFFENPVCGVSPYLVFIGFFLSHANSAINPCIYGIFNNTYRQGFKRIFIKWFVPRCFNLSEQHLEVESTEVTEKLGTGRTNHAENGERNVFV